MDDPNAILNDLWIDIMGYTKEDWAALETLASTLKMNGTLKGNDFKCALAALAIWVDGGKGLRESDH